LPKGLSQSLGQLPQQVGGADKLAPSLQLAGGDARRAERDFNRVTWRVVWITGASTGIGAEIAKQLADAGCIVATSARKADVLNANAKLNANLKPYPLDVTNAAAVAVTFTQIEKELGSIDLVIAGAGTYAPLSLDDFRPEAFQSTYQVNYLGVINVLSAVLPVFRTRKSGHVSWIASVAGYIGLPKAASYGPTKAALINLAECLAPELAMDGVTTSIINPGFVKTPLTAQNDFEMPFLMEVEDAARLTIKGLAAKKFEVSYPWKFVRILKTLRLMPYVWFFCLVRKFVLKQ
jgi:NAD(P)-dependent dehydrogenase (short-subunit alcohol dehydrogenase family)